MRRPQLDIQLKSPEQIEKMRGAGLVVAAALAQMRDAVAPGVSTADLDAIAEGVIRDAAPCRRSRAITAFRRRSARR